MVKKSILAQIDNTMASNARPEIIEVAETIAREKELSHDQVFDAIEFALQKMALQKYGHEHRIRAKINRANGSITLERVMEVVEAVENDTTEISISDAKKTDTAYMAGDIVIMEQLPPMEFNRLSAQSARQSIMQRIKEAERTRQYNEYKDRIGEIVSGIVKQNEFGNIIVELQDRAEGILRRNQIIPREVLDIGTRIRCVITDVQQSMQGQQITLSRTSPMFVSCLFAQEVPEIYEGTIEIKAIARDAGSRSKVAVYAADNSIDPVGASVGFRGSRIQNIINELGGEKIDVIPWTPDLAILVVNAFIPATISKVIVDEDLHKIDVVVADDQLSLAIGRRGQNVRLVSQLVLWEIDVLTEDQEAEKKQKELAAQSKMFIDALDVDEMIAHLLIVEGFQTIDDIINTDINEIEQIKGFDENIAKELHGRAILFKEKQKKEIEDRYKDLAIEKDLQEFSLLTTKQIMTLGEHDIKSLEDLADLATDEVMEMFPEGSVSIGAVKSWILKARQNLGWFE